MDLGVISFIPKQANLSLISQDPQGYAKNCFSGYQHARVSSLKKMTSVITRAVWSPCLYTAGRRAEKNFLGACWAVLDFDDPGFSLEDCLETVKTYTHIIGTTKSHQKEKNGVVCDRFRLCLMFQGPVRDLNTYKYNMAQLIRKYGADEACKDGARLFWPCKDIISINDSGQKLSILTAPALTPEKKVKIYQTFEKNEFPRWMEYLLKYGPQPGQANNTCFKVACNLAKMGYDQNSTISILLNSAIPVDQSEKVSKEVKKCVVSAFNSTRRAS